MSIINVGIVGAGRIAGHHIKAIKSNKLFKICCISDLILNKGKYYSDIYKIPFYKSYSEMLKLHKELDLVAIITPSGMHYEHAKNILKKFKKNILVEKPTFLKSSQVKEIYSLGKKFHCKVYAVFQNRYNKAIKRLKKAIINKELGDLRIINVRVRWCRPQRYYDLSDWRGTFSHDGGALTNQGIHHIDLLRYLFGEVRTINANMKTYGANIEVEDTVTANLTFKSNCVGTLEVTTSARPFDYEASISVVGSKGLAQVGGLAVNELQIFTPKPGDCKIYSQKIPDAYGFGHYDLYKDIAQDMKEIKKFPIQYVDCYKTIRLLNAFYSSHEKNKTILVDKIVNSQKLGRKNEKISKKYR
jgi:UDP-N-acetyl-2-amino-2-deoxyglucuronate dehydrogenase